MQAKALLQTRPASITDMAMDVGFDDAGYFSWVLHKYVGCTPLSHRNQPL